MKIKSIFVMALAMTAIGCADGVGNKDVKIIAHRGYWDTEGASKNSIASLMNAMEIGAYGSEFDVLVTSDGVPVIHHDDFTTNGIHIEKVTYAELMENAPLLSNGEKIPTLDEYLAAWDHNRDTKLILEIKSATSSETETFFVERILDVVEKHAVAPDEIEYIAFSWHVCKEILRMDNRATISYLNGDKTPSEVAEAGLHGIDYHYDVFYKNSEYVQQSHDLGLIVNAWTVNDAKVMRDMANFGLDYITTDKPLLLKEVLEQ